MVDMAQRLEKLSPAQRKLLEARLKKKPNVSQPIAIVGMSCRLPGARSLDAFWDLISNQRCAVTEIPPERWDVEEYFDKDPDTVGKTHIRWGAFVDEPAEFDAMFFGIAPREAARMDPQQRLLLECAWESMEHSGIPIDQLQGSQTGVFVGIGGSDYGKLPLVHDNRYEFIDAHVGTGNALSIAANRLSYIMDLRGPSLAVDTACSSGLVGLHYAVQSLRNGECDAAFAGAANMILSPEVIIAFSKARMLSPNGECRPFDEAANGYVRGEGIALVLLKRLTDATRDGDNVLAVIRGTAVNQDGRTSGITAPNSLSQIDCIQAAHRSAGIDASQVNYVEAHGTGTPLGDPIEFQSLTKIFAKRKEDDSPVRVTSVKANIGHTETVSGIAGLIKVALMMKHGVIPGQRGLENLNSNIKLEGTRLEIPTESIPWDTTGPRMAGVSSFGFGGTNSHIIMESVVAPEPQKSNQEERPRHILTLSAKAKPALAEIASSYIDELKELPAENIVDFCHSANLGRADLSHRTAIIGTTKDDMAAELEKVAEGKRSPKIKQNDVQIATRPKLAFLFTGQGSQFINMGREFYEQHPVFRENMDRCNEILQDHREKSLIEVMYPDGKDSSLNETEYTQPALFALEYSLAKLWQSWGVTPSVLLGHSVGEYVAACIGGVFNLEDGLRLIAKRGALMQRLPQNGKMAVVFATRDQVEEVIRPLGDQIAVATANGPENNVISGEASLVEQAVAEFEKQGAGTQSLKVSHAFHSPLMDPMLDEFERFAAGIAYHRPIVPIVANRTGQVVETAEFDAAYWRDHIRNCVEFATGMTRLEEQGVHAFLELGPSASLLGMGRRCLPEYEAAWIPSLRKARDSWDTLLGALGELYALGVKIDWRGFERPWNRTRIVLPSYPFQRNDHWLMPRGDEKLAGGVRGKSLHPLLGARYTTAVESKIDEGGYSVDNPKHRRDHVVQGSIVVPAAAYIEQGLACSQLQFGEGAHAVENIAIQGALFVPMEGQRIVQVTTSPELGGRSNFETYSISAETQEENPKWQLHVTGTLVHGDSVKEATPSRVDLEDVRSRFIKNLNEDDFYAVMTARNLNYGPAFRILDGMSQTTSESLAPIAMSDAVKDDMERYHLHPALGDALMQAVAGVVPLEPNNDFAPYTYVPMQVRRVRVFGELTDSMFAFARRTSEDASSSPEIVVADTYLVDGDGNVIVEFHGVTVQRVGQRIDGKAAADPAEWVFDIHWNEQSLPQAAEADSTEPADTTLSGQHLVLSDGGDHCKAICEQVIAAGGEAIEVIPGDAFGEENGVYTVCPTDPEDFAKLLAAVTESNPIANVIHAWSPTHGDSNSTESLCDRSLATTLLLLQQLTKSKSNPAPAVWFVTRGAQAVSGKASVDTNTKLNPFQSALWGMGRVAALEHPEYQCRLVDLDPGGDAASAALPLIAELNAKADETQIAYRDGSRYLARLKSAAARLRSGNTVDGMHVPASNAFRLRIANAGSFDALHYEEFEPTVPGDGEVQIEVRATGLNFSDVLKALGLYPGITDAIVPLGIEAAGVVTAVGKGVERFVVGDEVMGVLPYAFASHATTRDYALVKKPSNIDFEEASTIPITFLTAYYGLIRLAGLQKGERVLIHAGAGGVGQAAIQIAKHIGAEMFCTAGSDEKRDFLRSLGVEHVMNSRTLDFADEIRDITDREGIDVVLNSLPGDAISSSLGVLRAYGRFLEIGKTDIYSNSKIGLLPFQDNLSYFAIDLDRMLRQRPQYILEMFEEMMQFFADGIFEPLPFTRFETNKTIDSFRYMAQRKNIGKVVIHIDSPTTGDSDGPSTFSGNAEATYLITGGLGALGMQVAEWLGNRGAKHVALMSRRKPSDEAQAAIAKLGESGLSAVAIQGDVSDAESLKAALAQIPAEFPTLKGIFHAAGVLADGVMFDMDLEQLRKPLGSKIQGTWNLHQATADLPIETFVMFSSVAAILGSPGQSNYAAGNAFLDGMAAYRQSQGQPGLSINWGPWASSGMAADGNLEEQLASRGMGMLPSAESLDLMGDLIGGGSPQTAVMSVNWTNMLRASGGKAQPLLRDITADIEVGGGGDSAEDRAFRDTLEKQEVADRKKTLSDYFSGELANIMGMEPEDIEVAQPLAAMGLDSLMAIELKNKIESKLQMGLPMSVFMEEPSIDSLATYTAENFGATPSEDE